MRQTEDYKRELVLLFFSQIRVILWTTALIAVLAVLIAYFWPPTYAAHGTILVKGKKIDRNPETLEKTQLRAFPIQTEDLHSEAQFVVARDVIEMTVKHLNQQNLFYQDIGNDAVELSRAINEIKSNLKTEVLPASNVVKVTLYDKDPDDAALKLGILMDQYIIYRMQVYNPTESESFFAGQAEKFRKDLERKEDELLALVSKTKVSNPKSAIENNILTLNDLEQQLNALKSDAIEKELFIENLEKSLSGGDVQYFSYIENSLLNDLSSKLLELITERGNVARVFNTESEKVASISRQIDGAYESLKTEVQAFKGNEINGLTIINEKINSIQQRIEELKVRNVELQHTFIETQRITRETDYLQYSYGTFSKRREEAKINSSVDSTNLSSYVSIIGRAFADASPVFPKKNVTIPLGILVGFITGCSLGFLREYFDHTFKKPSDVTSICGQPLLFSIPDWNEEK